MTTTPARAKRSARTTPKVSPLRGMALEDWIKARSSGWQTEAIERLLVVIRTAAPEATIAIKWGQPVLEDHGPIAFIKVAKAHVTLGFWRGAELPDPKSVLNGGEVMRHMKVTSADGIDEVSITRFVQRAVRLNRTKGDPTRGRRSSP